MNITPDPPVTFGQNVTIGCSTDNEAAVNVNWSTIALSANISNQTFIDAVFLKIRNVFLNAVDSGYCGTYVCTSTNSTGSSLENGTIAVTVGKYIS